MSGFDWTPPVLTTPRLLLRPLTEADAGAVFAYASNPNLTRFTLWDTHHSLADSDLFVGEYARAKYREGQYEPYGITWRGRPDWVIGTVGCYWASRPNGTQELGYALAEEYWNRGVVTEAAAAVIAEVFRDTEAERVQAHCMVGNAASARVLEKLGMAFEGVARHAVRVRGEYRDVMRYAVLRGEFAPPLGGGPPPANEGYC